MSIDPTGRSKSSSLSDQERLEYLKGMASAPMGWPATPPDQRPMDPRELEQMLDNLAVHERAPKVWYRRGETYFALLLFVVLIASLLWLI